MGDYITGSVKGRYIADYDEFRRTYSVGDWTFRTNGDIVRYIEISTLDASDPRGCILALPLVGDRPWRWNGSKESPTLEPSIDRKPIDEKPGFAGQPGWHGFLVDGELRG